MFIKIILASIVYSIIKFANISNFNHILFCRSVDTVENVVSSADEHTAGTADALLVASNSGGRRGREPMRATESFPRVSAFSRFESNAASQSRGMLKHNSQITYISNNFYFFYENSSKISQFVAN